MEIYLHVAEKEDPELLAYENSARVIEVGGDGDEAELIWLEDSDEPLAGEQTLAEAGVSAKSHLHRSRCRRIEVRVRYGGRDFSHSFAPSATIKRVFAWATGHEAFKLTDAERLKHVLAVPGADHFLAPTVHIGSVAEPGTCNATLELAPRERFEG